MSKPTRIIYPPIWLVFGLVTIFVLNQFLPLARFTGSFGFYLGGFSILIGLVLLVHAGGMFKAAETDLVPFKNVSVLVTTGVYRVTRNPMYLGMTLVLLGTAITVGAFSALFVPPIFMAIIEIRFIRPEEQMLRELFGAEFETYCGNVRRWL
jgi:protein-S-isoprenylcysteine O-methyltransferase Ste14